MEVDPHNGTGMPFFVRRSQPFQEPEGMKYARIVLEICIGAFGIAGNLLVCVAIATSKRLRLAGNIFVFNLALADLGVLLVCLPVVILNADFHYSWPLGDIGCKIALPFTDIFYGVSIGSIVGISFHRYRMIVHCMGRQVTANKAKIFIVLIWILSYILFVLPVHFVMELRTDRGKTSCRAVWSRPFHRQLHVVFVSILFYLLPLAVILGTYLRIRHKLSADSFLTAQVRDDPTNTVRKRLEQNKKALKLLTPVVVAFAFLMFPINAIRLANAFDKKLYLTFRYLRLLYNMSVLLLLANSSINCVIYAVVNKDFRREFTRLLCCGCLKRVYEAAPSPRRRLSSVARPRGRFYSLYSTSDPKTVEEILSRDLKSQVVNDIEHEEGRKKTKSRKERLLTKLNRREVRHLMEDEGYADTVHYSTYGENLTIVVR